MIKKISLLLSLILIIISYIVFAYLTYYPLKNDFFFDTKEEAEAALAKTEEY